MHIDWVGGIPALTTKVGRITARTRYGKLSRYAEGPTRRKKFAYVGLMGKSAPYALGEPVIAPIRLIEGISALRFYRNCEKFNKNP